MHWRQRWKIKPRIVPPSRSSARSPGWWIIRWRKIRMIWLGPETGKEGHRARRGGEDEKLPGWRGFPSTDKMVPRLAPAFRTFFSTEMSFRRVPLSFRFLSPVYFSLSFCFRSFIAAGRANIFGAMTLLESMWEISVH